MSESKSLYGILVEFDDSTHLVDAAKKVRDAGYTKWDCHTPLPLHGMDEAMGIKATIIPYVVLVAGITGCLVGIGMQCWMNGIDYPYIISGKPFFSIPAFIPITFETTILFSALTTVGLLIGLNGLPQLYHPLFSNERFARVTDDRFFLVVEAADPKFDETRTREFLESMNGLAVERVED